MSPHSGVRENNCQFGRSWYVCAFCSPSRFLVPWHHMYQPPSPKNVLHRLPLSPWILLCFKELLLFISWLTAHCYDDSMCHYPSLIAYIDLLYPLQAGILVSVCCLFSLSTTVCIAFIMRILSCAEMLAKRHPCSLLEAGRATVGPVQLFLTPLFTKHNQWLVSLIATRMKASY